MGSFYFGRVRNWLKDVDQEKPGFLPRFTLPAQSAESIAHRVIWSKTQKAKPFDKGEK
jgi:hypothetical protein